MKVGHTKLVARQMRSDDSWHCTLSLYRFWWFRLWPQFKYSVSKSTCVECLTDIYAVLDSLHIEETLLR